MLFNDNLHKNNLITLSNHKPKLLLLTTFAITKIKKNYLP